MSETLIEWACRTTIEDTERYKANLAKKIDRLTTDIRLDMEAYEMAKRQGRAGEEVRLGRALRMNRRKRTKLVNELDKLS